MRHPNQQKGLATYQGSRSNHTAGGHTDASTEREDARKLDAVLAAKPKKPPHRHVFFDGGCKVCGMLEVEST